MSLASGSIRRPVTTLMVFLCLGVIGVISTKLLQLEFFPDIEFPGILVEVPYSGSSPEEVERLITRPIEEVLATMGGVRMMRSRSSQNGGFVFIFFGWDADTSARGVEARDKIDGIRDQLPQDVRRVFVRKFTTSDEPFLVLRISSESGQDLATAYELLERNVKRRLERINGVAQVSLDGAAARQIRIQLLADRITAHGVDLNDLRQRLQNANFSLSAGYITDPGLGQRVRVSPLGEFQSIEEIRELPINDSGLRLRDIAEVTYEPPEQEFRRLLDRQPAIGINIFKETRANLVDVTAAVMAEVEEINRLPEMQGLNLYVMFSQAEGVTTSLKDLAMAGLIGAALSFVVLFLFLRQVTATAVVALSVPCACSSRWA